MFLPEVFKVIIDWVVRFQPKRLEKLLNAKNNFDQSGLELAFGFGLFGQEEMSGLPYEALAKYGGT